MTDPVNPPTDYERYIIRRPDPSDVIKELTDGSAGFASCINGTGAIFGPELHKKMQKSGITYEACTGGGFYHGLDGQTDGKGIGAQLKFRF